LKDSRKKKKHSVEFIETEMKNDWKYFNDSENLINLDTTNDANWDTYGNKIIQQFSDKEQIKPKK
jgi:hypothetical protein